MEDSMEVDSTVVACWCARRSSHNCGGGGWAGGVGYVGGGGGGGDSGDSGVGGGGVGGDVGGGGGGVVGVGGRSSDNCADGGLGSWSGLLKAKSALGGSVVTYSAIGCNTTPHHTSILCHTRPHHNTPRVPKKCSAGDFCYKIKSLKV